MANNSTQIIDSFSKKLNSLNQIRKKQESLFSNNKLANRDIEEVYGAIFLNVIVSFEAFIEDLFIGLLARQIELKRFNFNVRIKIYNRVVARDLILQGRNYFDWFPYENTERIAKVFFTGGRPFTDLTPDEKRHINKCQTIRNAIAHQSQYAIKKFKDEVLANISLTPRERTPKRFLRAQFSANPPIIYYEQLVSELNKIALKLC
ncbi:MAG: hypothetical protein ACTSRS_22740 [Candidatus Helarchaeota archaeon]